MMLSIRHLDVKQPLRGTISLALGILTADLFIERTRSDIPPGIILWDINLGVKSESP
jgi:hypothetical protein